MERLEQLRESRLKEKAPKPIEVNPNNFWQRKGRSRNANSPDFTPGNVNAGDSTDSFQAGNPEPSRGSNPELTLTSDDQYLTHDSSLVNIDSALNLPILDAAIDKKDLAREISISSTNNPMLPGNVYMTQ